MSGSNWARAGLGLAALGLAFAGMGAQPSGDPDVSSYPPEVQKEYQVFADKCSRCHDLSRPLNAKYTTEAQWREVVGRMARKPGAGISPKQQTQITQFLVYRQKAQSGGTTTAPASGAAPPAAEPSPSAAAQGTTAGNGSENPAASSGGVVRAGETTESGGLRIEVDALPAQPITVLDQGHWTTQQPMAGETLFLSVRLFDAATGEKVPYAKVQAHVGGDTATPAKPLQPLFGAHGFQYGANFAAPSGDLMVSLEVEPPSVGRVSEDGHRWTSPLNLKLTLHSR